CRQRAGRARRKCKAAHAHRNTAAQREVPLEDDKPTIRRDRAIGDVVIVAALDRELAGALPADEKSLDVAFGIEAALGNANQGAGERQTIRHEDEAFKPFVARKLAHTGRQGQRLPACPQTVFAIIEAENLMPALDADKK